MTKTSMTLADLPTSLASFVRFIEKQSKNVSLENSITEIHEIEYCEVISCKGVFKEIKRDWTHLSEKTKSYHFCYLKKWMDG